MLLSGVIRDAVAVVVVLKFFGRVGGIAGRIRGIGGRGARGDDGRGDGGDDKDGSADLGDPRHLGFIPLGLVLSKEGLRAAGNGPQALTLTLLQKHRDDQHDGNQNQYDVKNNGPGVHGIPPKSSSKQIARVL